MSIPDPSLICFVRDSKLRYAEKDLRSAIRRMRNQLDSAERCAEGDRGVVAELWEHRNQNGLATLARKSVRQ